MTIPSTTTNSTPTTTTSNTNLRGSVGQGETEEYVPVGLRGILETTKKLKAVSRGLVEPDERESLAYKTFLRPDKLLRERIRLDAGKLRLSLARKAAKMKSLKAIPPSAFDDYGTGLLIGNPLASPLEEINPLHLTEQNRRVSAFGPGGIGSTDAVTEEATAIHPSQFGFLSVLETPESGNAGLDARLSEGVHFGSDGNLYQVLRNKRTGQREWVSQAKAAEHIIGIPR